MEPKDIVHTSNSSCQAWSQAEVVARQLVLKFPFMRDDFGTGCVSLTGTIYEVDYLCSSWHEKVAQ